MKIIINRTSIQNFALYLYFFSINIENFNLGGYGSISYFCGILYLILLLPSFKKFFVLNENLYFLLPLFLFVFYLTIVSILNINNISIRVIDTAMILNMSLFLIIANHPRKDPQVLDKAMFIFAFGSFLVASLLFLGFGVEQTDEGINASRETFFNAGPNEIAIKLTTGAIILFVMLFQDYLDFGRSRILFIFCIPIIFLAVFKTGSRTALLVPILAFLSWYFFRVLASKYKIGAIISGIVIGIIVLLPLIYLASTQQVLIERVAQTGGIGDTTGATGRLVLWTGFFTLMQENLIFGNGLSGFDLITYNYFGFIESPHNVLLELILYTGLIGLFIFSVFVFRAVKVSFLVFKQDGKVLPILLVPTLAAFMLALQGLNEKVCWAIFAYIIGSYLYN